MRERASFNNTEILCMDVNMILPSHRGELFIPVCIKRQSRSSLLNRDENRFVRLIYV